MLIINNLTGFGVKKGGAPLTYSFEYSGIDSGTSLSFPSIPIGIVDSTRYIFVVVHWISVGTVDCTACTIGGISATKQIDTFGGGSTDAGCDCWVAAVPTGTTADITATLTENSSGAIGVWAVYNLSNPVPYSSTLHQPTSDVSSATLNLSSTPTNGLIIAASTGIGTSTTWTGLTEKYTQDGTADSTGADAASVGGSKSISISHNATCKAAFAASWL